MVSGIALGAILLTFGLMLVVRVGMGKKLGFNKETSLIICLYLPAGLLRTVLTSIHS